MGKDIHASREKVLLEIGARFKEAVRSNQSATDLFDETLTQFLGINRTDGRCLDIIDRLCRVSAGQLAIESGLTTGAVTAVVDRLESAGYVRRVRDPVDRRKVWIEITEETQQVNRRIFGLYEEIGIQLMQRFTPGELSAILAYMEIGTLLNREMAQGLREHSSKASSGAGDSRLEQANAFARAMKLSAPRLLGEVEEIWPSPGRSPRKR